MPDILDPYVGASGKEQPLDGDEEEADDVGRKRYTHKEHREGLRRKPKIQRQ